MIVVDDVVAVQEVDDAVLRETRSTSDSRVALDRSRERL